MKLESDGTSYGTKDTKGKLSQERHPIHPSTSSFQITASPWLTPQAKPAGSMGWERDVSWSNSQDLDHEWGCGQHRCGEALLVPFLQSNGLVSAVFQDCEQCPPRSLRCSLSWSSHGLCCVIGIGHKPLGIFPT